MIIGAVGNVCGRCHAPIMPPAYGIIMGDELIDPYGLAGTPGFATDDDAAKLCAVCQRKLQRVLTDFMNRKIGG